MEQKENIMITEEHRMTENDLKLFKLAKESYYNNDFTTSLSATLPLAEKGDKYMQSFVAFFYHYGKGVEKNYEIAFNWYKKSADQGYDESQDNLGVFYLFGHGTKQNVGLAFKEFIKAAEQGYTPAQLKLAMIYEVGLVNNQSNFIAYFWYSVALLSEEVEKSKEFAEEKIKQIEGFLTQEQKEKAKELAQKCVDSGYQDYPV